ncbi:MAG: hypothetical protein JW834_04320 [Candidatus Diapherotrites archaeon]|nr:hypothetical protein [Candidatus Diapherotrites archaeon]
MEGEPPRVKSFRRSGDPLEKGWFVHTYAREIGISEPELHNAVHRVYEALFKEYSGQNMVENAKHYEVQRKLDDRSNLLADRLPRIRQILAEIGKDQAAREQQAFQLVNLALKMKPKDWTMYTTTQGGVTSTDLWEALDELYSIRSKELSAQGHEENEIPKLLDKEFYEGRVTPKEREKLEIIASRTRGSSKRTTLLGELRRMFPRPPPARRIGGK